MKARVKATGEIVEVEWRYLTNLNGFNSIRYVDQKTGISYFEGDLDFDIEGKFAENCLNGIKQDQGIVHEPDYYTRLEHQAAIAAMQGMLNNSLLIASLLKVNKSHEDIVAEVTDTAIRYAHALVEKYKKEEK